MSITPTERAEAMALQVLISARLHNGHVVTHDLVDAVMSRDAGTEQGKANKESVRRIIRKQAASENVRVLFTDDERYWAIREQLHHMTPEEVAALSNSIAEGGDRDPRGWDRVLIRALSAYQSRRPAPSRLWGCKPVSIRLWRQGPVPTVEDVVDAPHAVYVGDERVHEGIPASHVRTIVGNLRFKRAAFTQDPDGAICVEDRAYVPQLFHMRTVNGGTPERIDSAKAMREIDNAMMKPGKDGVREMSAAGSRARIVYRDVRGTVELRPATREEAAATVKPERERYAVGDLVIVRPVVFDSKKRRHRVMPEYLGTVGSWASPDYMVRSLVADEDGHGVRPCRVHELRPATEEERVSAAVQAVADPLDDGLAAYFAETYAAVADGTAVPVRADKVVVGMDVIAAVRLEDRTIGTVDRFVHPYQPSVAVTWEPRDHRDSVMGDRRVFSPDHHLVVTVDSIARLTSASLAAADEEQREANDRARRAELGRKAYEEGARLDAQRRATNEVIEEHARMLLLKVGYGEARPGTAGFVFRTNHNVVGLYAQDAQGEPSPEWLDVYRDLLECSGWFAEYKSGYHGSYLAVLPPTAEARAMVEEAAARIRTGMAAEAPPPPAGY
ncbi:hypothetical protein [Streptomyces subrutilus]|uniref:Uncharacterized protein n=1 Tax=Streptomyces subrutilus TaxID=36818 RepID=A0A1E5NXQ1_9ACTN|nr:hypothetical protein [Streptomyces subrutilus]OEJ21039.1 hypothetical protein BGK67_34650 [Streptomyces subrutilus]